MDLKINMEEISYQNIDTPNTNPLTPEVSPVKKTKRSFPKDPKIRLLLVLGIIVLVLLVLSLVVSLFRPKTPSPGSNITVTPTSKPVISPTQTNIGIPTQFVEKFNQIDKQINTTEDFLPPSFDQTIGQ